jgi:hypothetical protein
VIFELLTAANMKIAAFWDDDHPDDGGGKLL